MDVYISNARIENINVYIVNWGCKSDDIVLPYMTFMIKKKVENRQPAD